MRFLKFGLFILLANFAIVLNAQDHLTHKQWNTLLQAHVSKEGKVNYANLKKDEKKLDSYLMTLSKNHPKSSWHKDDQLAFWINAYNAFTVKLIVKNYPVKSIKDLGGSIYKVNTSWDIKFIKIGEKTYDLNNIEHDIIRKEFNEPRIHFAVNCASVSCPNLRNEAFVGSKLDQQLDEQAKSFINDKSKNDIQSKSAKLSKIFRWFKGDFEKGDESLRDFINKYSAVKLGEKIKIEWNDYLWDLNE
ncbi:MAG: hypothetical protein ACI857_002178 [Arenicella sp.]|jgi:hypothetical protein